MPLRNPFKRTANPDVLSSGPLFSRGFSAASTTSSEPTDSPPEPVEYQLSEINDSGVFLPPPPENSKPSFWHTKSSSSFSTHRSTTSDTHIEPFNMSRESFDSYRRSFDISARAPVTVTTFEQYDSRRSLDSSLMLSSSRPSLSSPRISLSDRQKEVWPEEEEDEEEMEDVKLADDSIKKHVVAPARKRGLFARFVDSGEVTPTAEPETNPLGIKPSSHHSFQFFSSRKRGQSGQGDELRSLSSMPPAMVVAVAD